MKDTVKEWEDIGTYSNACADTCSTIISLFESELPEHVKKWLYDQRKYRREEAIEAYKHAIEEHQKGMK